MFRKFYINTLLISTLVVVASAAVFAQGTTVRGKVELQKKDGTTVPAADITIEAFRTDIGKGSMPSTTTNKKGEFSIVGFQPGQTYAIAVSGAGIGPRIEPSVKAGRDNIVIIVNEGDGRKLTEAEVREVIAQAEKSPGGPTEAQKKEQEDLAKKNAEIMAKNKKMQDADAVAIKANTDGIAALKAKDFSTAIAKFDEGITAVPDYVGSTPVMLNGKLVALKSRGYEKYREGAMNADATTKLAKYAEANKDFDDALAAFDQAMAVIKNAPAPADEAEKKSRANVTLELLNNAMEVHRLKAIGGVDTTKGKEASVIFDQYFAVESDPVKKSAAQLTLGDILRENGDCDAAVTTYKQILAVSPENVDALAGAGLCLFSVGYGSENKAQMQEGLNYMTKFIEVAPETHRLKTSVKDAVELLKNEQKLTPQKTTKKKT